MTTKNDGGPAFAAFAECAGQTGMSLRDYFAGQALAGEFSAQNDINGIWINEAAQELISERAKFLYRFADAMLAAREAQS